MGTKDEGCGILVYGFGIRNSGRGTWVGRWAVEGTWWSQTETLFSPYSRNLGPIQGICGLFRESDPIQVIGLDDRREVGPGGARRRRGRRTPPQTPHLPSSTVSVCVCVCVCVCVNVCVCVCVNVCVCACPRLPSSRHCEIQGYLAHKQQPFPLAQP